MVLHLVQDNVGPDRPLPQAVADIEGGGATGRPRPADNPAMALSQIVSQSRQQREISNCRNCLSCEFM